MSRRNERLKTVPTFSMIFLSVSLLTGCGKVTTTIPLSARHTELGDYYGRGRVCVLAVSGKASFLTNIVTVPEAPDETTVNRVGASN